MLSIPIALVLPFAIFLFLTGKRKRSNKQSGEINASKKTKQDQLKSVEDIFLSADINNGHIEGDHTTKVVWRVEPINISVMSNVELEQLFHVYRSFLSTIQIPISIYVVTGFTDVDRLTTHFTERALKHPILPELLTREIQRHFSNYSGKIRSTRYYLVGHFSKDETDMALYSFESSLIQLSQATGLFFEKLDDRTLVFFLADLLNKDAVLAEYELEANIRKRKGEAHVLPKATRTPRNSERDVQVFRIG